MDNHGQIGPEKPRYLGDLRAIARVLEADTVVEVKFAAVMGRWMVVMVPRTAMRTIHGFFSGPNDETLVAITEGHRLGVHTFPVGTWHSPEYVGAKLWGVGYNAVDALTLSGFLNRIERLRLAHDDESMRMLEVWEWQVYEALERKEGGLPTAARFSEITGCEYQRSLKFANGQERVR